MNASAGVWLIALVSAFTLSCGRSNSPSPGSASPAPSPSPAPSSSASGQVIPLQTGIWGGSDSVLTVQENGAQYRRGCQTGQIPQQVVLDANGMFDVQGTIIDSVGGPIHPNDVRTAEYKGVVSGNTLSLTVTYVNKEGLTVQYNDTLAFGFEGPLPAICPL